MFTICIELLVITYNLFIGVREISTKGQKYHQVMSQGKVPRGSLKNGTQCSRVGLRFG